MIILIFDSFISFSLSSLLIVLLSDVIDMDAKLISNKGSIRRIRDFKYTPNFKRAITIIDPETTEEIKPVL